MLKIVVFLSLLTLCLVVLPVTAMAQTSEPHYACTTGDWDGVSVWKGNSGCTGDYIDEPDALDPVTILSGKTVAVNVAVAECRSIDVESTATLNIETGNELQVNTDEGELTSSVNGTVYLKGDDSRFQFLGGWDHTLDGSGEVIGEHEGAVFEMEEAVGFDFTTEITIRGKLEVGFIDHAGFQVFTFTNTGTWHADTDGTFLITVGSALSDNPSALYKVSTNALAVMEPRGHSGNAALEGSFEVHAGQLKCIASLTTTGKLTQTGGTIFVTRPSRVVFSETP